MDVHLQASIRRPGSSVINATSKIPPSKKYLGLRLYIHIYIYTYTQKPKSLGCPDVAIPTIGKPEAFKMLLWHIGSCTDIDSHSLGLRTLHLQYACREIRLQGLEPLNFPSCYPCMLCARTLSRDILLVRDSFGGNEA